MAFTITQSIIDELRRPAPRFIRKCTIVKNLFNADTRVVTDITDRILSWGSISMESTASKLNWELPNVTIQAENQDQFLSPFAANSFYNTAPVQDPLLTIVDIAVSLQTDIEGTIEPILEFFGTTQNVSIVLDNTFNVAEITVASAQTPGTNRFLNLEAGGRTDLYVTEWTV